MGSNERTLKYSRAALAGGVGADHRPRVHNPTKAALVRAGDGRDEVVLVLGPGQRSVRALQAAHR